MFLPFLSPVHLKLFSIDGLLKSLNLSIVAKSKIDAKIPATHRQLTTFAGIFITVKNRAKMLLPPDGLNTQF